MSATPPAAPQPAYGGAPVGQKTNTLAIVGLILAFVFSLAGLIVSIIANNQIKQTGEAGAGLAKAGIIISIVFLVLGVIGTIAYIGIFAAVMNSGTTY